MFCFEVSLKLVDFVYQMYIKIPVLCLGIVFAPVCLLGQLP